MASLWREKDGSPEDFQDFCMQHFLADEDERAVMLEKVSRNLEVLQGHFNQISLKLKEPLHLPMGELTTIDQSFGGFTASSHLEEDLYASKIGFQVALNFPWYSLADKEALASEWDRSDWAAARLGDFFT